MDGSTSPARRVPCLYGNVPMDSMNSATRTTYGRAVSGRPGSIIHHPLACIRVKEHSIESVWLDVYRVRLNQNCRNHMSTCLIQCSHLMITLNWNCLIPWPAGPLATGAAQDIDIRTMRACLHAAGKKRHADLDQQRAPCLAGLLAISLFFFLHCLSWGRRRPAR
jgi:hypothetical protein